DADAPDDLVGEHGHPDAEGEADRHREERVLDGDPQRVPEVARRQHVAVLLEPDVHLVAAEEVVLVQPEGEGAAQRVEDEDAEQHERRRQHQQREQRLAQAAAAHGPNLAPVAGSKWWRWAGAAPRRTSAPSPGTETDEGTRAITTVPSSSTQLTWRSWPRASIRVTRPQSSPSASSMRCSGRTPTMTSLSSRGWGGKRSIGGVGG